MREVDSMLNARPLTRFRWHPATNGPLTTNHFLLGRPHPHIPLVLLTTQADYRAGDGFVLSSWHDNSGKAGCKNVPLWIERTKWTKRERQAAIGNVVLIVDEKSPRGSWPTGQITKGLIRKGKENKERKQTVRAAMTEDTEWRIPAAGGETVSTKSCTRNWWHNEGERRGEDVTFQVPSCRKWTMLRIKTSKNKQ